MGESLSLVKSIVLSVLDSLFSSSSSFFNPLCLVNHLCYLTGSVTVLATLPVRTLTLPLSPCLAWFLDISTKLLSV